MNGILDWREYKAIVSSYDVTMMTTLAIDGLTSAQDTTVAIGQGKSESGSSEGSQSAETTGGTATSTMERSNVSINNTTSVRDILQNYYAFKLQLLKLLDKLNKEDKENKENE